MSNQPPNGTPTGSTPIFAIQVILSRDGTPQLMTPPELMLNTPVNIAMATTALTRALQALNTWQLPKTGSIVVPPPGTRFQS